MKKITKEQTGGKAYLVWFGFGVRVVVPDTGNERENEDTASEIAIDKVNNNPRSLINYINWDAVEEVKPDREIPFGELPNDERELKVRF